MRVEWQTFTGGHQTVEAQFYFPTAPSDRLVLMCSGFPGAGATRFEQRHAAALAESGYTLCVIKHAGIRTDGPDAPFMINNAMRLHQARQKNETHLGGGPSTIQAWLNEPFIILDQLRHAFKRIDVIGNSFGAVAALWSLIKPGAPIDKIRTLLLYAGAQGVDSDPVQGIMRIWNPMFLSAPVITDKITLDSPASVSAGLKQAYADIAAKAKSLPASITLKYLVVAQDELLKFSDTQAFKNDVMGGRGEIIVDDLDKAYPAQGLLAHDTPDYPSDMLMELLA